MRYNKGAIMLTPCVALLFCMMLTAELNSPRDNAWDLDLYFCHFELPKKTKDMNASFSIVYSFVIDGDGKPQEITRVHDDFVGKNAVSSCVKNWRLTGFDVKAKFVLAANWRHGIGWVEMSIVGDGFNQRIRRYGDLDPYSGFQNSLVPDY